MVIEPVGRKPKPIPFGIYKQTIRTDYGYKTIGEFRGKLITFHYDTKKNTKMVYVENTKHWIKSKLEYFQNGIKKIIRSEAKC